MRERPLIAIEVIEHEFENRIEFLDHIAYVLQICRNFHGVIIFDIGQITEVALFVVRLIAFR